MNYSIFVSDIFEKIVIPAAYASGTQPKTEQNTVPPNCVCEVCERATYDIHRRASRRAPHVVRRDVVVLMDPEVGGVLDALGHGQRLVVRARVLHEGPLVRVRVRVRVG